MSKTLKDVRAVFPISDGWAVRSWLTYNEDGRCVVQATLSDAMDHVVASSFGDSNNAEAAEDYALRRLSDVVCCDRND